MHKASIFSLIILLLVVVAIPAYAEGEGKELYCAASNLITGSVGTIAGLMIALLGFISFGLSGSSASIIMIIVGISVTAFPGIMSGFLSGMSAFTSGDGDEKNRTFGTKCSGSSTNSSQAPTTGAGKSANATAKVGEN